VVDHETLLLGKLLIGIEDVIYISRPLLA